MTTGSFGTATPASYPTKNLRRLDEQQALIAQGVDVDMTNPRNATFAYLGDLGIATSQNTSGYAIEPIDATTTMVFVCLKNGTTFRVTLYQPFPDEERPIWAVRSYAHSPP